MKKLFIYPIFITAVLIISCEQPTDSEDPGDVTGDEPIAEETIGNSGGTVSTDKIAIEIPSGALDTDQQIQVFESGSGITGSDKCII